MKQGVTRFRYNPDKIEKLYQHLLNYEKIGRPLEYRIVVDGVEVVCRTSDTEMFRLYEDMIDEETRKVEVIIYKGTSQHCSRTIFVLSDDPDEEHPGRDNGLSGIEVDNKISEALQKQAQEIHYKQLEEKNKELEEENEELEEEIEGLEKEVAELKAKQSPMNGILGDLGSAMVEGFIRRNPHVISKIPGGQALAGLLEPDMKQVELSAEPEGEVSFKPKGTVTEAQGLTEMERMDLQFVAYIRHAFSDKEFAQIIQIIERLKIQKDNITDVLNLLDGNEEQQ